MMLLDHPALLYLRCWIELRASRIARDERGETTEKVIITALFAALALAAGAIIILKVTNKANSISTDAN
jgi:hypothetical protein